MAHRQRIEDLTEADIVMYKKDIEKYKAKKKIFHIFGIIFLIIFIISLVGTITYSVLKVVNVKPEADSFIDLMTFFVLKLFWLFIADNVILVASIAMFVNLLYVEQR